MALRSARVRARNPQRALLPLSAAPALRGIGYMLLVPVGMAVLSVPVCLVFGEFSGIGGFVLTALVAGVPGASLIWATRSSPPMQRSHAMVTAGVAWLLVPVAGMAPFVWAGHFDAHAVPDAVAPLRSGLNALFESVSGYTSTGLSILSDVERVPAYIHWWRSFTEWVGGIGVVVLMLTILPASRGSLDLYESEGREEKISPTVRSTVKIIWTIFAGLTVVVIVALWAAGEPLWQAINHGMAAIATGGFSITNDSVASSSGAALLVYCVAMTLGAMSFAGHYLVFRRGQLRQGWLMGSEHKLFWALLFGGVLLFIGSHAWQPGVQIRWIDSAFMWVSALTTTGFGTTTIVPWPSSTFVLLILIMLVGAMAGSTGSGIKHLRLAVLIKSMQWQVREALSTPHQVQRYRIDRKTRDKAAANLLVRRSSQLAVAYVSIMVLIAMLMLYVVPEQTPVEHVFFEIASAQGNVGLSTGLTSADLPAAGRWLLCAAMYVGRLELLPVALLLASALRLRRAG